VTYLLRAYPLTTLLPIGRPEQARENPGVGQVVTVRFNPTISPSPSTPQGVMIQTMMRAVVLDDAAARARGSGWEATGAEDLEGPYEPLSMAVVLCTRRYFGLGQDVRDLHRYVATVRTELAAYPDAPPFPPREAEAVLRSALDEHYLLTEVDPVRRVAVESLLLAVLARDLRPTAEQIDAWASGAEAAAERLLQHGTRFGGGRWEVLIPSEEREAADAAPLRRYELIKSPHPPVPRFRARQPQTLPGRYARAVVRGDRVARDRFSPQLGNAQTGTRSGFSQTCCAGCCVRRSLRVPISGYRVDRPPAPPDGCRPSASA
jgi:hypothetical protein